MVASRAYVRMLSWFSGGSQFVTDWQHSRLDNLNRRSLIFLVFVIVLLSAVYIEAFRPPSAFPAEEYITIEEGASLRELSHVLAEKEIVRSAWWLELIVRLRGGERNVHAGDYLFAKPVGAFSVARIITTGAFGLEPVRITIPEGATVSDMAIIYERRLFKFDADNFLNLALDLEGYLYPDTYHFLPNVEEEEVIRVMSDNFNQHISEFEESIEASGYSLHEIITLASIIEKEAWKEHDRQLISGVLHNRLNRGMLLQVDATFTYTHNKGTYDITLAELTDKENPYNTYVHAGLPPGPIAAVGDSSIYAALNPRENDYLFYLADRYGTTYYSKTYDEHLVLKRRYVD